MENQPRPLHNFNYEREVCMNFIVLSIQNRYAQNLFPKGFFARKLTPLSSII